MNIQFLDLKLGLVLIQELYISKSYFQKKNFMYTRFYLYQLAKAHDYKKNQVFFVVKKNLLNITILKNLTNLVSYLYYIVLNIIEKKIYS